MKPKKHILENQSKRQEANQISSTKGGEKALLYWDIKKAAKNFRENSPWAQWKKGQ